MNIKFLVRKAVISDAEDIYYINKTSLGYEYDFEKQKHKIEAVLNDETQVIFVAETENKVVGYIHLVNYDVIQVQNTFRMLLLCGYQFLRCCSAN